MALPSTTVWEIRSTATASNVNGGGFNSARGGTDYTLQNAAQLTVTDIACAAASLIITSVTGGFTSAMVGNLVHLYSLTGTGALPSWYEITGFTDGNTVTVDRTPTNGADAITAGTCKVGGAMSLNSTLDDDFMEMPVNGNTIYIKAGTYSLGESISVAVAGTALLPIKIIGYNATRGDNPTGTDRPIISMGASNITLSGAFRQIYNIIGAGTASNILVLGVSSIAVNCYLLNKSTTAGRGGLSFGDNGSALNCEAISYLGLGIDLGNIAFGCYVHHCANGIDISNGTNKANITNCIVSSCRTAAISNLTAQTGIGVLSNNTLYGSEDKYGIGVNLPTTAANKILLNNIVYGFVTGVAHADTQASGYDDYNNYFNNTNDVSAAGQWQKGGNDVAIDPAFADLTQILGTTGAFVAGGSKLVDTSKNFSALGVVAGVDIIHLRSGTGVTEGMAGIASISTTTNPNDTLNFDINPGTNVTADKVYSILLGHNFAISGAI